MRGMHWSWDELQRTPSYVRKYCLDFLRMAQAASADRIKGDV